MTRTPRTLALAAVLALAATGTLTAAPAPDPAAADSGERHYHAIDLGFTANYYSLTMNDRGQVVGSSTNHTYRWQAGRLTLLAPPPGFTRFTVGDINERGTVVGTAWAGDGTSQAAVWRHGTFTLIDRIAGRAAYGMSINDWGTVYGTSESVTSPDQSFLWRAGTLTPLWHNNPYSSQVGINNWGDIVGQYEPLPGYPCLCRGARWHDGELTDLGDLGGTGWWLNEPTDVNNRREIVGNSATAAGESHAYLWRNGVIRDLGTLGGRGSAAAAISDRGVIVGLAHTVDGAVHPFRWQGGTMVDLTTVGLRATDRVVDVDSMGRILGVRDGRATLFVR
ncbi:hypothetical protein O7632_03090 [Solwaraspora sp. WMMD406]|uniref:hypothetical protein n=1 Tax=Solwaraspora sp. WMMD406 TaxID=3016095 RepID=UPI0024163F2D|nr:hypothetical protein [Solwaraspora sp. WMMD406]MDG4763101.1 hypothetical protein [Solwaraspora sp. WMMD406]